MALTHARAALAGALMLLTVGPGGVAAQEPPPRLAGPSGTSASKVLVIGTDGTRFDLLRLLVGSGRAPRLARLGTEGFAVPSLLAYEPPEAATLSEVGWSTIATGVWPAKHGVNGMFLNNDPRQATKNGYLDFLSKIEQVRPRLSTFLASNWANIGRHENGGPIFGDRIDARSAVAAPGTIDGWDRSDQQITDVSARYLRGGNPDAGLVYLGVVDQIAHSDGSANARYLQGIRDTDRRIGQMLDAIRARPTYLAERWTVIVTTDHGQQDLAFPSAASHGFGSDLERTVFVAATGFGLGRPQGFVDIRVVDVAPTVLARLGIAIDPAWNLDGRPFATAVGAPRPIAKVRRRGRRLRLTVRALQGAPALRAVALRLPRGMRARSVRTAPRSRVKTSPRRVRVRTVGRRRLRVGIRLGSARRLRRARRMRVLITDVAGARTVRALRVR